MISKLYSGTVVGVDGVEVEVEVDARVGNDICFIVGLPDVAVKESAQRVKSAIANSGFSEWSQTYVVNLAPAELKKQGSAFDLPIALGMIATQLNEVLDSRDWMIVGELSLDGGVRSVRGMLSLAMEAKTRGRTHLMIPRENASEAAVVEGVSVYPVSTLREAWNLISQQSKPQPYEIDRRVIFEKKSEYEVDFEEIKGQPFARRAMEVAAAGGHNILLCGSPGSGKTMFAQRLPTILPEMSDEEAMETGKVYSVCGLNIKGLMVQRPFRAPHHTISDVGLMGGGSNVSPGEVSLAHNGVLFLDELPEFQRRTLETLRQPLEAGQVVIARASGTFVFPCRFMLMAAMNPCPCGYLGDPKRACKCLPGQIAHYRRRISGPLLDRFDLLIEVPPVDVKSLAMAELGESSAVIRARVKKARDIQENRYRDVPHVLCNAHMTGKLLRTYAQLSPSCQNLMNEAIENLCLSARAHDRILKVARTIADLGGVETVEETHLFEAIQFRQFEASLR